MGLLSSLLCTLFIAWSLFGLNTAIGSCLPAGAAKPVPPNASLACTAEEPFGLPENAKVPYFAEGAPDEAFPFLLFKLSLIWLFIEVNVVVVEIDGRLTVFDRDDLREFLACQL